jgi:hypothetical protein
MFGTGGLKMSMFQRAGMKLKTSKSKKVLAF